ncbi:MAG TPA: VCBS repeat-containing protein [Planctomycetota bacterium]|nr:VCBS repeat-containing protein [Planctomycetota bacterium]
MSRRFTLLAATVLVAPAFAQVPAFVQVAATGGVSPATSLAMRDFDGDGRADVVFADAAGFRLGLSDLNGTPRAPISLPIVGAGAVRHAADVDGDGVAELLVTVGCGGGTLVFTRLTSPGCGPPSAVATPVPMPAGCPVVPSAALAPAPGFAGPAFVDALTQPPTSGATTLRSWSWTLAGGFVTLPAQPAPSGASALFPGDLDGDGDSDLLVAGAALSGDYHAYLRTPAGLVPGGVASTGGLTSSPPILGDFDADGDLDFVTSGIFGTFVMLNQSFAPGPPPTWNVVPTLVAGSSSVTPRVAADVDADGDLDLVCSSIVAIRFMLNDGAGGFTLSPVGTPWAVPSPFGGGLAAGDVDADGDADLVTFQLTTPAPFSYFVHLDQLVPSAAQRPGTGDPLAHGLAWTAPGAGPPSSYSVGPLQDVRDAPTATVDLYAALLTPTSWAGAPWFFAVDAFPTGCVPPPLLPGLALTSTAILLGSGVVPSDGLVVFGPMPLPPLVAPGVSGVGQFAVLSPSAANGTYAASDAQELRW